MAISSFPLIVYLKLGVLYHAGLHHANTVNVCLTTAVLNANPDIPWTKISYVNNHRTIVMPKYY